MAIYHVAKTGSDSNNGTSLAQAWLTVKHASLRPYAPGDQVYIHPGTYVEIWTEKGNHQAECNFNVSNGTAGTPIVVRPAPGAENQVILTHTQSNLDRIGFPVIGSYAGSGGNHVRFEGLILRRPISAYSNTGVQIAFCTIDGVDYPPITDPTSVTAGLISAGCIDLHMHHCKIMNWRSGSDAHNHGGMVIWTQQNGIGRNYLIEDNWFVTCNRGIFDKDHPEDNIFRRNYFENSVGFGYVGSGQNGVGRFEFYNNLCGVTLNSWQLLTDGSKVHNNIFRRQKACGTFAATPTLTNMEIYNNIHDYSSGMGWYQDVDAYSASVFNYFNHNIYRDAPIYRFSGSTDQSLSFMTTRGWETNSQTNVNLSTIYNPSWDLINGYNTAGRNGGAVGPQENGVSIVASILDTSRYGAAAYGGDTPPPPPVGVVLPRAVVRPRLASIRGR